ncbi:polysaccharide deacetylase family protein [Haloprofundus salilacus]|uniref:polysaccharide deacetylase family protein n=1 Tax=Haloprofundus salilacus TaxID=2876190 RepID=UPI001CCC4D61|nr:polysaccharide deacetylase family protein [Haloprofundus salilacus]
MNIHAHPTNILSFDVEHWHSATLLDGTVDSPVDRIETSTQIVLDVLRRYDVRATFFIVGKVAEQYPELVSRIADEGHEIASHGHTHTPLFDLSPDTFERELTMSSDAIQEACGHRPVGFRAPNFSVTRKTEWAFEVLESSDYRYDSSVFPMRTPMYGVSNAPLRPYHVPGNDPFRSYHVPGNAPFRPPLSAMPATDLVEYPLAVTDTPARLPVAGGFYARLLPIRLIEWGIRGLNRRGIPATIYFHPWEFNPAVRTPEPSLPKRFVSFHGIEGTAAKLERLLRTFEFGTIRDELDASEGNDLQTTATEEYA